MNKLLYTLIPPPPWRMPVAMLLGIFAGLFLYTFKVSNAVSYLSDEPETCINCHIMRPEYASWFHSSHRLTTTCNDCHVPHNNVVNKYFFKAKDGLRHATIFTLRAEPQVIQIKDAGKKVVQENCKRCHERANGLINTRNVTYQTSMNGAGHKCWDCHRYTPHGTVKSLSSTPNTITPRLNSPAPKWLHQITK